MEGGGCRTLGGKGATNESKDPERNLNTKASGGQVVLSDLL